VLITFEYAITMISQRLQTGFFNVPQHAVSAVRKLQISNAVFDFKELAISLGFWKAKRIGFSNTAVSTVPNRR